MKTRNRVLAALLALLALSQSGAMCLDYAAPLQLDLQGHAVFMSGQEDGLFHPNDPMTRAEAAQILYTLIANPPQETGYYPDVDASAWYSRPVGVLGQRGLLRTDGAGNIRPGAPITRAEFAYLLGAFLPTGLQQGAAFFDVPASYWAADAITSASMFGIFCGYVDGTFRPEGELTRAEAATVVNRLLGRTADLAALDAAADRVSIFPDVLPDFWAYGAIMEAAVPHASAAGPDGTEVWSRVDARPTVLSEGYHTIDGRLYRVKDGIILHSTTVDGFTYDAAGRYTTGSDTLDERLSQIVSETTNASMTQEQKLRALYNYVRDNYTYLKRPLVEPGTTGWEPKYAEEFFAAKKGNCFSYAAAFCLLARQLGVPAYTVVGKLVTSLVQDHGWVEISIDGKTYLFDTELEWSFLHSHNKSVDLFMVDVNNPPYTYRR